MKTIVLEKPGQLSLTETAAPHAPAPDEALVRVHRVGICGTDWHAFRGRQPFFSYPRIIGHELGVEIVALGSNASKHDHPLQAGDRCAVEPYLNCGQCIACRRGKPNCCVNLQVLGVHTDGGMRELITVPINKLHRSATLSWDQLALVETLCIGAHAVARADLEAEEWVLVIGAGPIGLSVIQFAQLTGARVIVTDINEDRLRFCREQLNVVWTIRSGEDSPAQVLEITGNEGATSVFDATGNQDSMAQAFSYVAHGGRLIFVGLMQGDVTFHDPDFHRREMTLLASRNATVADFRRVIGLLEEGPIDTAPWVTHRAPCGDLIPSFTQWLNPSTEVIKAVVEF